MNTTQIYRPRAILGALGVLALALMVSRCSPISPNIPKSGYDDSPGAKSGEEKVTRPFDLSTVNFVHVFTYVTKVMDAEGYRGALTTEQFPAQNRVTISPGATPLAFADFSRTGRLIIEWHGELPQSAQSLFAVGLTRAEIQEDELYNFETTLHSLGENKWMVSVSPAIDESTWERVRDNLLEITIYFKTKAMQAPGEVVPLDSKPASEVPATEPSPAPSAAPDGSAALGLQA